MPKNKPNKGLLKRIRITKSGRVKSKPAFGGHLRSHKSGTLMRSYRKANYAHSADVNRAARMLHRRIVAADSSPSKSESSDN
ncbi:MAG TPA: 50S ribosomal protein L35 [Phycisphaerales bacterium]|jgi:large subunit ribosomal protein L35|nr:50S ribosomal protein L35 [Phycisphaerales bacterium]